jgi:hypothetical protein
MREGQTAHKGEPDDGRECKTTYKGEPDEAWPNQLILLQELCFQQRSSSSVDLQQSVPVRPSTQTPAPRLGQEGKGCKM